MKSFPEFESAFLGALQQERSGLQGLQGKPEAQLSGWIDHLFQRYLGYTWEEILRGEGTTVGAKGGKKLYPDLRIGILDNGVIFIECKRLGRLDGPKGQAELNDAVSQVKAYIHVHTDQANIKLKTVLGVVTDGNRWHLMGLDRTNQFHTIAEWTFLTDDPRLIAQRLWLLAKPALAEPTSALVEFLARRTLADVLKGKTKWLAKKVNQDLPNGSVSEELVAKWLRDAFSDASAPTQLVPSESSAPHAIGSQPSPPPNDDDEGDEEDDDEDDSGLKPPKKKADKPVSLKWEDDPSNPQQVSSWKDALLRATEKALALGLAAGKLPMPTSANEAGLRSPRGVRPGVFIETHASADRIQQWVSAMLKELGKNKGFLRIVTRSGESLELPG